MKRSLEIVVGIQALGGALFFAALFVAPLSVAEKLLAAVGLIFLSCGVFVQVVSHLAVSQSLRSYFERLLNDYTNEDADLAKHVGTSLRKYLESEKRDSIRVADFGRLGYLLLALFFFWLLGGWILARYVI